MKTQSQDPPQTETKSDATPAAKPPGKPKGDHWYKISMSFIDHRATPLRKHQKIAIEVIEGLAKWSCFDFHRVAKIAEVCGCKERQMEVTLKELAAIGYIRRIPAELGKRRGMITLLLKRLDPDRPVFDPDGDVSEDAIRDVVRQRKTGQSPLPFDSNKAQWTAPSRRSGLRLQGAVDCAHNKESLSLKKDEPEEPGKSLDQRQRKDNPTPAAAPAQPELPRAEALTAGQERFLASLTADQRSAFDAWPASRQADALAPHRLGFDRVIAADALRQLAPPPAPPPPLPPTMAELWEQLPGKPRAWSSAAAEALTLDFGGKKDRQLWSQFNRIAEAVRAGRIDPAHVVNAHRQAMKPGIDKPGAMFWSAFQGLAEVDSRRLKELAEAP